MLLNAPLFLLSFQEHFHAAADNLTCPSVAAPVRRSQRLLHRAPSPQHHPTRSLQQPAVPRPSPSPRLPCSCRRRSSSTSLCLHPHRACSLRRRPRPRRPLHLHSRSSSSSPR